MTELANSAEWCAIDLAPGAARIWAMTGDTERASASLDRADDMSQRGLIAALRERIAATAPDHAGAPALVCGLSGGADPIAVPAKPGALAAAPLDGGPDHALPGLRQDSPPGLMRGAAVRIAGFLALNPNWDGVVCLPGPVTHWAQVSADEVVSFQSFLTGETAAALAAAPSLRAALAGDDWDNASFDAALDTAMSRPERLAAGLAAIRAEAELGGLRPGQARARLLGLLLGAELAAARPYWLGQQLALIGPEAAAAPYATALARQGVPVTRTDAARMTLAGLTAARRRLFGAG